MARRAGALVAALAALLSCTACSVQVAGTPSAGALPSASTGPALPNPDRVTASDGLGDLPTWDPCSVLAQEKLRPFGQTLVLIPESLDYCRMSVQTEEGSADVTVGWLDKASVRDLEGFKSETRQGGLRVVSVGVKQGGCIRWLVFDDGVSLTVKTVPTGGPKVPSCELSDAVADRVIDAVMHGRSSHFTWPPNSLGGVDPCSLMSREMLAKVRGLPAMSPEPSVSGHRCRWRGSDDLPLVAVHFQIGVIPYGAGRPETIAGRDTVVSATDDEDEYSVCEATSTHVQFQHNSLILYERATVYVFVDKEQGAAACDRARAVAAELWPKLPPA